MDSAGGDNIFEAQYGGVRVLVWNLSGMPVQDVLDLSGLSVQDFFDPDSGATEVTSAAEVSHCVGPDRGATAVTSAVVPEGGEKTAVVEEHEASLDGGDKVKKKRSRASKKQRQAARAKLEEAALLAAEQKRAARMTAVRDAPGEFLEEYEEVVEDLHQAQMRIVAQELELADARALLAARAEPEKKHDDPANAHRIENLVESLVFMQSEVQEAHLQIAALKAAACERPTQTCTDACHEELESKLRSLRETLASIQECMVCPLRMGVYEDPVTLADGFTYERRDIEEYFEQHILAHGGTQAPSPFTRDMLEGGAAKSAATSVTVRAVAEFFTPQLIASLNMGVDDQAVKHQHGSLLESEVGAQDTSTRCKISGVNASPLAKQVGLRDSLDLAEMNGTPDGRELQADVSNA